MDGHDEGLLADPAGGSFVAFESTRMTNMSRPSTMRLAPTLALAFLAPLLAAGGPPVPEASPPAATALEAPYEEDVAFALDELEKRCGGFFSRKGIDWRKVRKEFSKAAKEVESDQQHLVLLNRLVARLRDGHAYVAPMEKGKEVAPPPEWQVERRGPGFFLCQVGKKVHLKNVWSAAAEVGLEAGDEVLRLDEQPVKKWIEAKIEEVSDLKGFSTDQHALFWVLHRGAAAEEGARLKIEFKDASGKKRKRTITYRRASLVPNGPAFVPEGYAELGESVRWAKTPKGFGYVHFRRTGEKVIEELDQALAALGNVPGIVLDFRGNSGGGCDHDAFEARFVPAGHELPRMARSPLPSAGAVTYGGPMVVIVDGTVVSAGETTSGMFMEDGRGYMIGESATAGMSSQKEWVELPSGLFKLYVSVRSNRSSFNGGQGIEGIGVAPQELVEFDPGDLRAGVDTLIRRAEELLERFPQKEVRYDPKDYGWKKE